MMVDSNGRIAYHGLVFRDDGGVDYIQRDFDGGTAFQYVYRRALPLVECRYA